MTIEMVLLEFFGQDKGRGAIIVERQRGRELIYIVKFIFIAH